MIYHIYWINNTSSGHYGSAAGKDAQRWLDDLNKRGGLYSKHIYLMFPVDKTPFYKNRAKQP